MTVVEGDQKAPFSLLLHQGIGEGATPFPGLLHFTLNTYLILLSVKQGGIEYQVFYMTELFVFYRKKLHRYNGGHHKTKTPEP